MTLTGHIVGTKGNTGRGIASIVENADYTITINLTDGSSYTTAPIAGFTAVDFDENYDLVVTKTDGTTETVETDIADYNALLKGYKDDAETAATNANTYQGWAQDYASNAQAQAGYASTYKQAAYDSQVAAGTSESNAGTQALKSEGYAVGKQNGTDVSSGSDYYHNNAKYYSDMAHIDATDASDSQSSASGSASTASAQALKSEGYAVGKQNGTDVTSGSDYYQNNSKYYKEQAATSASSASTNALKAEGFAVGEQNGTAVSSGSPYYENNAEYYAGEAADSATAAAASAASLTVDDEISSSSTNPVQNKVIKGALDTKANIDGAYESMTVGNAEQLVSTVFVNDEEPYNFRTAGGSADIGDRLYDTVVGVTVAWNQLVQNGNFEGTSHWGVSSNAIINGASGGVLTFTAGAYNGGILATNPTTIFPTIANEHKYLAIADIKLTTATTAVKMRLNDGYRQVYTKSTTDWQTLSCIYNLHNSDNGYLQFLDGRESGWDAIQLKNVMLIDLTAMFGSTIADYIYSLEQANAGAGVAWFRKLFPKTYYAYNAGELMSVNTSAHNTVGFNLASGDVSKFTFTKTTPIDYTKAIRVINGAKYEICCDKVTNATSWRFGILCYDANGDRLFSEHDIAINESLSMNSNFNYYVEAANHTNTQIYFTPLFDGYVVPCVTAGDTANDTVAQNTCIHLRWDGERDGEYEEYIKHSYPLDSSLTLRGIPKLDASNNLYYDGDVYESDGSVTRKYAVVDLGTLNWGHYTDSGGYFAVSPTGLSPQANPTNQNACANIAVSKAYTPRKTSEVYSTGAVDMSIGIHSNGALILQNISYGEDYAALKTSLSGTYLVYELETPTTESADPFQSPQIVDDFGTEEYVDYAVSQGDRDVAIPVGHETQYMANLKAKLEMSPNSPEGAGDYIVRQTNGENEYVTLASNATIQDIIARLEALEGGGE